MSQDGTKERISGYEILAVLGDGAQGKVYKARVADAAAAGLPQDTLVALKVLHFAGEEDNKKERFHQSAKALHALDHPAIVRYHVSQTWRSGEWDEAHLLAMEFLDGETLADRLKRQPGGLPWPEVKAIFDACLDALIYAAGQGLIHRDLKPANIFLPAAGGAKIIDFDIARHEGSAQASTVGWKGTFDYMAPDFVVVPGFRGDEQSDVFSLTVCFHQALTGSLPFPPLGEGAHIGYLNRWNSPGDLAPNLRHGAFRVLYRAREFVRAGLAIDRGQRLAGFAAMREELGRLRFRTLEHKGGETYELVELLGRGGFGEVFKGISRTDGHAVAIKYLYAAQQADRFLKEAKIIQKYSHDALVRYVDFIEVAGSGGDRQFFLVLEYLDGMPAFTLRGRIKAAPNGLPPGEVLILFRRYLDALQFLHENAHPIIHRDIKPGNLYAPAGRPEAAKIFDLGIARDVTGTATSGGVPGTLDYMAPEFGREGGGRGSPQSDLYALGLCLYEALTGRMVFPRLPTDLSTAWRQFSDRAARPPPVDFSSPLFSALPALRDVILAAIDPDPARRPASAVAMRSALEAVEHDLMAGPLNLSATCSEAEMTLATAPAPPPPLSAASREAGPSAPLPAEVARAEELVEAALDRQAGTGASAKGRAAGRRLMPVLIAATLAVVLGGAALLAWRWRAAAARSELVEDMVSITAPVPPPASPAVVPEPAPPVAPAPPTAAPVVAVAPVIPAVPPAVPAAPASSSPAPVAAPAAPAPVAAAQPAAPPVAAPAPILAPILAPPAPASAAAPAGTPKPPAPVVALAAPRAPLDAFTPAQRTLLEALDKRNFTVTIPDPVLARQAAPLFAAMIRLNEPFDLLTLPVNRSKIPVYQGQVATDLWNPIERTDGAFGAALRQHTWLIIRDHLVQDARRQLLTGKILLKTAQNQSAIRRVFLYVLTKIDDSTGGKVSACEPEDPLRRTVETFFSDTYFNRALLEPAPRERDQAWEQKIPWLARLFEAARQ
ncbi:MAG: serine/threonine-protein kinase [Lentisphaeria bacterium]